jgi:hypothetical protein
MSPSTWPSIWRSPVVLMLPLMCRSELRIEAGRLGLRGLGAVVRSLTNGRPGRGRRGGGGGRRLRGLTGARLVDLGLREHRHLLRCRSWG